MSRIATWLLVGSLAGTGLAGGIAVRQERAGDELRAARASLAARRARLEALERRTPANEANAGGTKAAVEPRRRPLRATVGGRGPDRVDGATASPTEAAPLPPDPLVNDPALQNLYLAAERANFDALYLPLYRRLGLSESQIAAFRELVLRREEQRMDLADIQQSHELDEGDPALAALSRKAGEDFETRMRALLGAAAYLEFTHYERTLPVLRLVNRFAGAVALAGQPLAAPQAEALTLALAQASPPFVEGGAADPNRVEWPVALAEAEIILTPPQQQAFLNMVPRYPIPPVVVPAPPPDPAGG